MRINFWLILTLSLGVCILTSCSSSSEETKVEKQTEDTTYVFDKVPPENSYKIENPEPTSRIVYLVQIGAFSTLENAGNFAESSRTKLKKDIKVEYDGSKKLYVVRINQIFNNKNEAIEYRDDLKKYSEFNDAWVVEVTDKNQKQK